LPFGTQQFRNVSAKPLTFQLFYSTIRRNYNLLKWEKLQTIEMRHDKLTEDGLGVKP
jgi:hypothetical protein